MPEFYNVGIRTMGPVLALSSNSPFLPPDVYEDDVEPYELLDETYHELRIPVFEQAVNPSEKYDEKKVRVPRDLEETEDVVDRVAADMTYSPLVREWVDESETEESYIDRFWEFDYKRGTYWRWLRAVIGGSPVGDANDERSVRIEYRPIPTQPTVRDNIAILALTTGLLIGLVNENHPVVELGWEDAKESFYNAVHDGFDAELRWVDAEGNRTTDSGVIFDEIFEYATKGLEEQGFSEQAVEKYIAPIRRRYEAGTTPSVWKIERVRERLGDGEEFEDSVHGMQRDYIRRQRQNEGSFADWLQ
ncbi:MAG: hypothetical protein SXQ77_01900 [Halobacteria archaeon]|nr:hypothetical protein [Halobacteria archaeon]